MRRLFPVSMSEYIELSTITPSSSEESVFNQPSTSTGVRRRGGYVSIPINSSSSSISSAGSDSKLRVPNTPRVGGAVIGAGSQYQPIFEGQLGRAAADPRNPLSRAIFGNRDDYYAAVPWELRRLGLKERQEKIKPYGDPWNKDTKAKYPEHWRLVNPRRGLKKAKKQEQREAQARRDSANLARGEPPRNGLVLPFSNNIGPGNPIRPATNRADLIAQGHDLHYQQAKSDSDVLSADREAISQFAHEAIQGQDPISRIHAAVGGIGLGVKHAVERLSGKVYYGSPQEAEQPSQQSEDGVDDFLQQVRDRQDLRDAGPSNAPQPNMADIEMSQVSSSSGGSKRGSGGGGPPSKVSKSGTSLPGTGGNLDGMVRGGSGEGGATAILRPIGLHVEKFQQTYRKKWRFLTSANANVILAEAASGDRPARWALTTGMASIPWEYLFFYMSPAEYNRMKNYPGTFAKSASVRIRTWNTRVAFQTGDTQTANATLNQNKFLQVAKGIRSIPFICSTNRKYTYSDTEPMQPTGFATLTSYQYRDGLKSAMYGYDNDSADFAKKPPADATGAEIYLQDYLTIYTNDARGTTGTKILAGFPPYKNFIEEFDASACINTDVVAMDYDFSYAPLVPQFAPVPNNLITQNYNGSYPAGTKNEVTAAKTTDSSQATAPTQVRNAPRKYIQGPHADTTFFDEEQNYLRVPIEQGGIFEEVNVETVHDTQMPSINVGIRAVPKLTTIDETTQANSWLDAQGYFEVDCVLTTESVDPYTYIKGGCYSANTKSQLQYFASDGRPIAKVYDNPNVYGRMQMIKTVKP